MASLQRSMEVLTQAISLNFQNQCQPKIKIRIGTEKQFSFYKHHSLVQNTYVGYYRHVRTDALKDYDLLFAKIPNYSISVKAKPPKMKGIKVEHLPDDSCPICLTGSDFSEHFYNLSCNHTFHTKCLQTWMRVNNTCPMCRFEFCQPVWTLWVLLDTTLVISSDIFKWITNTHLEVDNNGNWVDMWKDWY